MINTLSHPSILRGLTACAFFALALSAPAMPVSPEKAASEAASFLNGNPAGILRAPSSGTTLKLAFTASDNQTPLYYIFNSADGFIIMSADDKFPAVLGYSEAGKFDESRIPANMKAWLEGYASEIKHYLPLLPDGAGLTDGRLRANRPAIEPMVTTKWNQDEPFNLLCPTDRYGRTVTGCVATAYAQIMKFHEWPRNPVGSSGGVDFTGTLYNWRQMIDDYNGGGYTASQANSVATLMRQCGAAVNMNYSSWASGAYSFNVPPALTQYFKYDPSLTMYWKDYIPQKQWSDIVYGELAAGRPVYYSGASNQGGHAFVCDGYSENEYFHFNWGWGGYEDGYFLLTALNPASGGIGSYEDGYTSQQTIITGIKPGTESTMPTQHAILCSGDFIWSSGTSFEVSNGEVGDVIYNPLGYSQRIQLGIKISKADGSGTPAYKECENPYNLEAGYGFSLITAGSLPRLADGEYKVTPAVQYLDVSRDWNDVPVPIGCQQYVTLSVAGGVNTFRNLGPDKTASARLIMGYPEISQEIYAGLPVSVRVPVVNVGLSDFNDRIGFTLMDAVDEFGASTSIDNRYLIPAQSSTNLEMTFTDGLPAGQYILTAIDYRDNIYIDNYILNITEKSVASPEAALTASDITPNFFTSGRPSPVNFTVHNSSYSAVDVPVTFELLDANTLRKIKDLPIGSTLHIPGQYEGRINIRPADLGLEPGFYYMRMLDGNGKILSLPSPVTVNSEVLESGSLSYVETSRAGREAMIVAPETGQYSGAVEIPASIAGLKVKGLRNNAFTFSDATDVTLPATVNRISAGTFACANSLRNFTSKATEIIPWRKDIFPESLSSIWLNVDQDLVEEWHASYGWHAMQTPAWVINLSDVTVSSGLDLDPATGRPYAPYRMNPFMPLSIRFNAPGGKNVEVTVIVDHVWIIQKVINPSETLELPALGMNTYGEVRAKSTTSGTGIGSINEDDAQRFDIFSIDGRRIKSGATAKDLQSLPAGIYISAGRKILVK